MADKTDNCPMYTFFLDYSGLDKHYIRKKMIEN